jgi:hypothetical protein
MQAHAILPHMHEAPPAVYAQTETTGSEAEPSETGRREVAPPLPRGA